MFYSAFLLTSIDKYGTIQNIERMDYAMSNEHTTKRIVWIDSIRFFACLLVALCHLEAQFSLTWYDVAIEAISPPFIYLSGTWATAVFSVLIGYFAAKKGASDKGTFAAYTVKRYLQFAIGLGMAELLYIGFKVLSIVWNHSAPITFYYLSKPVVDGLLSTFFFRMHTDTLMAMPTLFVGSLFAYLVSRTKARWGWVLCIFAASMIPTFYGKYTAAQIGCVLLGVLLFRMLEKENRYLYHPAMKLLWLVLACVCSFGRFNMLLIGLSGFFFMLFCFTCKTAQKGLSFKLAAEAGKISFYIYLLHSALHASVAPRIYALLQGLPTPCQSQSQPCAPSSAPWPRAAGGSARWIHPAWPAHAC